MMAIQAPCVDPHGHENARMETFYAEVTVISEPYNKVCQYDLDLSCF